MTRLVTLFLLLSGLIATLDSASAADGSFKIVVGESVSLSGVKRADLSELFLKKKETLGDGVFLVPVNLAVAAPARQAFSIAVHGRKAEAIDVYWNRQLFSGRGVPPLAVKGTEEALAYLLEHADAISYVGGDVELPAGLRVVPLID